MVLWIEIKCSYSWPALGDSKIFKKAVITRLITPLSLCWADVISTHTHCSKHPRCQYHHYITAAPVNATNCMSLGLAIILFYIFNALTFLASITTNPALSPIPCSNLSLSVFGMGQPFCSNTGRQGTVEEA